MEKQKTTEKMNHALRLVRAGMSGIEVAKELGYKTANGFYDAFKAFFGAPISSFSHKPDSELGFQLIKEGKTVQEAAQKAKYKAASTLSNAFKRKYGVFPSVFQAAEKNRQEALLMQEAKRLLSAGKLTVKETARRLGFASLSTFGTAYKKHFHETPTGQPIVRKRDFLKMRAKQMAKAKRLIETAGKTVKETAHILGFKEPGHFARVYKKYFGLQKMRRNMSERLKKAKFKKAFVMLTKQNAPISAVRLKCGLTIAALKAGLKKYHNYTLNAKTGAEKKDGLHWAKKAIATGRHSLSEIAKRLGYASLSSFSKAYKGTFGTSPTGIRLPFKNKRTPAEMAEAIQQTAEALKDFSKPIYVVAQEFGFQDMPSFVSSYKKYRNETPLETRNAHKANLGRKMLLEEGKSIAETAQALGYQSPVGFVRFYRQYFKTSPVQEIKARIKAGKNLPAPQKQNKTKTHRADKQMRPRPITRPQNEKE